MKYLSLCSGIEAATVAWHPLGWEAVAYSEIERFPSEVLAHHYPSTPNLGDMTKFKEWSIESNVDLLVGGTPCQSFSVAGLRKGLDDPRGNLMLTYLAIADKYKPKWIVWENVPGVLSSNGGKDFGVFLGALGELGYGFAYRVLDAQYFGVAQRRRRVFVVGYLGDWRRAAAVLFERHSLQGHPAPSREKRKEVTECAGTLTANGGGLNRPAGNANELDFCITVSKQWPAEISSTLDTTFGSKQGLEDQHVNAGCPMFVPAHTFSTPAIGHIVNDEISSTITKNTGAGGETQNPAYVVQPAYGIPGNWIGRKPENGGNATEPMYDIAPCLTKTDQHGVAQPIAFQQTADCLTAAYGTKWNGNSSATNGSLFAAQPIPFGVSEKPDVGHCLRSGASKADKHESTTYVAQSMAVRRLTPVECERLQGFPDSYTDIKSKNKPTPDGPRYKALGNSMAVPVMAWIGQRIEQVEAICKQNK
jgi:DNA (cytosine-5)-methyltransferase 1